MASQSNKGQKPRGSRPDAVTDEALYLLKYVSSLRLTYQIRLLTFLAQQRGLRLIIRVPDTCVIHPTLSEFQQENLAALEIEKV